MLRLRGSQIESLMPSVDARAVEGVRLLDGRNVGWDSKGPKSAFASAIWTPYPFVYTQDIQGIRIGDECFILTTKDIRYWRTSWPHGWQMCYDFEYETPISVRSPWGGAFYAGKYCLCQEYQGFFTGTTLTTDDGYEVNRIIKESSTTIPGLPTNPIDMQIVRGRLIVVDATGIYWTGVGELDFTPELGGAGFQLTAEIVQGDFLALVTFEDSFIVYTTAGAIKADYIGGDLVWRFDTLMSKDAPINRDCVVPILSGGSIFLSQQGIQIMKSATQVEPLTPDFNEFLRGLNDDISGTIRRWRLEYDYERQRVFVMESADLSAYTRAYVLYPTIGKWGSFDVHNWGILPITAEEFGFLGMDGILRSFTNNVKAEVPPDRDANLETVDNRIQRFNDIPSSTARFTTYPVTEELEYTSGGEREPGMFDGVYRPGWYVVGEKLPTITYGSLDSWVQIGYIRASAEIGQEILGVTEINELVIGAHPTWIPDSLEDANIRLGQDLSYEDVDYDSLPNSTVDWDSLSGTEDWGFFGNVHPSIQLSFQLGVSHSDDGIILDNVEASVSAFYIGAWLFDTQTARTFNVIQLTADQPDEYWHIRWFEAKVNYGGSQSS